LQPDRLRRGALRDMQSANPISTEPSMKVVAKVLAALSVLALATPALACGDKNTKSAEAKPSSSDKVAKSGEKKSSGAHAKHAAEVKPATAAN
jgi:hypothetical protein